MGARARQALSRQAWPPMAATTAAPNAEGFRPKRRWAEALDHGCNVLRQPAAATWLGEGAMQGFFDHRALAGLDAHSPRNQRGWSPWLRSGLLDHGALPPPTAGVPPGGRISPGVRNVGWDGREAVGPGSAWQRRRHHRKDISWADAFIVPAQTRQGLAETILPRSPAFFADRGVRRSTEKTGMTPSTDGLAVLGQPRRQPVRLHGQPAQRPIPPSQGSCQGSKTQVTALGQPAVGATPARRLESRHPV
jgi:RNA-directed DNA polymerase